MRAARKLPSLYAEDFYAWTRAQARALAGGHVDLLDLANLAEEVKSLGDRDRRELRSRLAVLVAHLLKQRFQPEKATRSWLATIIEQRREIGYIVEASPSLRRELPELLRRGYSTARRSAIAETGMDERSFPKDCPFALEEVLEAEEE